MSEDRRHWQKILRREWRRCEDQDYARELFALISPEPMVWWAPAIAYMLVGLLYGAMGGLAIWAIKCGCPDERRFLTGIAPFVSKAIGIGGALGLTMGLWGGWWSRWREVSELFCRLLIGLVIGLAIGLFFGVLGLFSGTPLDGVVFGLVVSVLSQVVIFFWKLHTILELLTAPSSPSPDEVYAHRGLFWSFCKRTRPLASEVEVALRAVASGIWVALLDHLDTAKKGSRPDPTPWIAKLSGEAWQERFIARHVLAALGGEAVKPLQKHESAIWSRIVKKGSSNAITAALLRHESATTRWPLTSIGAETARQLGSRAAHLLCPRCFVRCQRHRAPLKRGAITYYGCRLCRQSVEWLEAREVVVVLDNQMALPWRQRDGRLYVNGLARGALFDCDRVAIIYATDDAVKRFCMQVGNDTDDYRRPRYRTMPYEVGCPLTENTRRILQHTFGGA